MASRRPHVRDAAAQQSEAAARSRSRGEALASAFPGSAAAGRFDDLLDPSDQGCASGQFVVVPREQPDVARSRAYRGLCDEIAAAATMTIGSGMVGRITVNFGCVHRHKLVVRSSFILDDVGARLMTARDPVEPGRVVVPVEPIRLATKPVHKGVLIPAFVGGIVRSTPPRTADFDATPDAILVAAACDAAVAISSPVELRYQ